MPQEVRSQRSDRLSVGSARFLDFFRGGLPVRFRLWSIFFLFNLYLTDLHFNERILGILAGTLTFGNVVGTIPITILVRRYGLRPLLSFASSRRR